MSRGAPKGAGRAPKGGRAPKATRSPRASRSPRSPKVPPSAPRGLLDALLTLALLYGVYASTPLGSLGVGAYRWVTGAQSAGVDPFLTFRLSRRGPSRGAGVRVGETHSVEVPPAVERAAALAGAPPQLLLAIVEREGTCAGEICTLKGPLFIDQAEAPGPVGLEDAALALARREGVFGDWTLATEALFVGDASLAQALERAEAQGAEGARDPLVHGPLLPPITRAGPLARAWGALTVYQTRTFGWPVEGGVRISSPFGDRVHPVLGTKRFHNGVDLALPTGSAVLAPARGRVHRVGRDAICGSYLKVDHGFGLETTYCHLSRVEVDAGAWVEAGAPIAKSGATGRVTGPHLHYILRRDGEVVDPLGVGVGR